MGQRRKPLSPSTIALYKANLARAFGPPPYGEKAAIDGWTQASLKILHAAALRFAPERLEDLPEPTFEISRAIKPPTESELVRFEQAVESLSPAQRALVLMPLGLGLRASEAINLDRKYVARAVEDEEDLLVLRKGGREQLLPTDGVRPLLEDLLTAEWDASWQILSTSERGAYQRLYRLTRDLGKKAGVKGMRPHKLRHGFATRMERAGASLPQIQQMMDHSDPKMTMRYVHPENKDIVKHLQKMKRKE